MVSGNEGIAVAQVQNWIRRDGVVQDRDTWTDASGASYLALIKSQFY